MKKVRFETPHRGVGNKMEEQECHSPRPFTETQITTNFQDVYSFTKILPYSNDPEKLFESSNNSPYPSVKKTNLTVPEPDPGWSPCSDLELSTFDAPNYEPRRTTFCKSILKTTDFENNHAVLDNIKTTSNNRLSVLSPIENKLINPSKVLAKDNDFFLRRNDFNKTHLTVTPLYNKNACLSLDKENNPAFKKAEMVQMMSLSEVENRSMPVNTVGSYCRCHHCIKSIRTGINKEGSTPVSCMVDSTPHFVGYNTQEYNSCKCAFPPPIMRCSCCNHRSYQQYSHKTCDTQPNDVKINAVDKKTLAIEKYEELKKSNALEVDRQANIIKEKREPTVSDLFKIIKLQNEQLQLLQDKVDKFILGNQQNSSLPVQSCITENVAIETVGAEQCKISIGVMTSFEVVRTSTIINKEVVKSSENAQIQCNRSQISIKEVVSKSQSPNLNFLDGIPHIDKTKPDYATGVLENAGIPQINEEKTLNELSLYNVQVDNATTPLMSPDQSLYLDVRDYSDSEPDSDDQSNIGWTYYNKVMTHVNGVLQDSDMPSSASAWYRNARQHMQTVQMQIDKSNVSVTKRVKFGDDPLGIHQPHIYAATTDTSLKMNQLAAKYLKGPPAVSQRPVSKSTTTPIDRSFATRNYMERHQLLQSVPSSSKLPLATNMPRFLDITALKQQPKLL